MGDNNINGNVIIGQSGGPTAAINATLSGIIKGVLEVTDTSEIYGMLHGIGGLIDGNIINLKDRFSLNDESTFELLQNTPAATLGSCRVKLPKIDEDNKDNEVYEKIFNVLEEKNIKYFFYIGGNDSMDTVKKMSAYANKFKDGGCKIIGVPKTIDNDLGSTDHSPGYGSAAKYIALTIQELCLDNAVYACKSVLIVEIMGRDAGWLTASAALPRLYGGRAADLVYLPEAAFDGARFIADIEKQFEINSAKPNIVVAVSEGIKYADGTYVCEAKEQRETDNFGHLWLSGAGNALKQLVSDKIDCKVRSVELNTPQRCAAHINSLCDITEAVSIGRQAVKAAVSGKSGVMMTFKRISTQPYEVEIGCEDINNIANVIRAVPDEYIVPEKNNVTDECLRYIAPLIEGESKIIYKNGLPVHFEL